MVWTWNIKKLKSLLQSGSWDMKMHMEKERDDFLKTN
jgi:hypothetical protein